MELDERISRKSPPPPKKSCCARFLLRRSSAFSCSNSRSRSLHAKECVGKILTSRLVALTFDDLVMRGIACLDFCSQLSWEWNVRPSLEGQEGLEL